MEIIKIIFMVAIAHLLTCINFTASAMSSRVSHDEKKAVGMANPASSNCADKGGKLKIEKRGDGGEFGVCYFEDNRQCEEWALLMGECRAGGIKVTGYITDAARYCAIIGGEYTITSAKPSKEGQKEDGNCKLKNGKICNSWDLWNGKCTVTTK